ncbi:NAD-dependent succinate-semialdehyde dehydrogenase [Maricaulis sp.]|uniref:NAD-dependent succinate-semialdehyde dehydrogenase n=1 Tax=Maricaulis sp. TaxID=1486257 RepID=UPI003A8E2B83
MLATLPACPTQAYIGGDWCDAQDGRCFDVTNPATGAVIARIADCGITETRAAIAAAKTAQAGWAALPAGQRSVILRRWRDLMVERADELALVLTRENGKPLAEARGEILYGASYLEWFAEEAKRIYGEIIPSASANNRILVAKQPVGVCAAITPWNFPNAMLMRKAAAALAAGCTMVAKPAAETPLSALLAAKLGEEAGVPAGVFNIVTSARAAEVGGELTSSPDVRKITFTGSTAVGRKLLEQSAATVKKASMELGGNAPFIVFDDADLDAAVEGAMASKFRNAGQTCVCANRMFIQSGIMPEFARRLAERVAALKVGDGEMAGCEVGPLINEAGLAKAERLVTQARAAGAKVLTGGGKHAAGELFYQPTVIEGVTPDMAVAQEEIFGPVAPLIGFETEAEVIAMANDTIYGLAAYLFTRDLGRAWRVGEALEYGMVGINEGIMSSAAAPFGGVKQSGFGREGSRQGLEDYLDTKYMLMGGLSA